MGIPAANGLPFIGPVPAGDKASQVETGVFSAAGPSIPIMMMGPFNIAIWASVNTALTLSQGSLSASVASGTGLAAGSAVNSLKVPPGTTWATFSGTSGTLALPTKQLTGRTSVSTQQYGFPIIKDLNRTSSLTGATVTGPGIPASTTVVSVVQPYAGAGPTGAVQSGILRISNTPTSAASLKDPPTVFSFALTDFAIATGTDSNAVFTGAGVTYSGSVQIERSFDGGVTWIVANSGGSGSLAIFSAGTPVNIAFGEPELGVLYRLNCTTYSSGPVINYRISGSGAATMALNYNQLA